MPSASPPRRSPLPPQACNLARAFDLIGDRWTLLILRSALYGVRRFDDFAAELGAPRTVLADRLKALTAAGLLARRDYREPGRRARPEYWLTPKSAALRLPFVALTQWADEWLAGGEPPPVVLRSRATGEALRVALVDGQGREVAAADQKVALSTQATGTATISAAGLRAEPLALGDFRRLAALLDAERLPSADLREQGVRLFAFRDGGAAIGYAGLEIYGADALLRSVVVDPARRNLGAGRAIVAATLIEARRLGATRAFLLTMTAKDFFERLGFAAIDRAQAPAAILATRQAAGLCPSSAPLMAKAIG